jgi:hypothetical protein
MTATDPRLAPLAEALHEVHEKVGGCTFTATGFGYDHEGEQCQWEAVAILAALPDGWCGHAGYDEILYGWVAAGAKKVEEANATIATLRAALDGLVEAGEAYFEAEAAAPGWEERYDALAAVLAAAKEATE